MSIARLLASAARSIPLLDAELLLAHVLGKSREYCLAYPEQRVPFWEALRFRRLAAKRKNGLPLAYLTGHKAFFGLDFLVNNHTLIPRPETELLVTAALEEIKMQSTIDNQPLLLLDIGTGTGCIPIAIQKTVAQWGSGALTICASDVSRPALRVARQNAERHSVSITFLRGSLLTPVRKESNVLAQHPRWIVTANLPYLTQEQFDAEPTVWREPRSALVAPHGGLGWYDALLDQIHRAMDTYSVHLTCFFEIDPSQTAQITGRIQRHFPKAEREVRQDLRGHDRLVIIRIS